MKTLNTHVHVMDPSGRLHSFGPGDDVPKWARDQITNPRVWGDAPTREAAEPDTGNSDTEDGEPPRTGKGSGTEAWKAYAESIGIDVPEGASRQDIVDLVDATN